jgi:outer membrane protein
MIPDNLQTTIRLARQFFAPALAALLLFAAATSYAQQPLSLQNSVQYAIQNNPQVHRAALESRKGDYLIKEYLSTALPQVNGSGNFTYNMKLPTQLIPNFFAGRPEELLPVQFGTALSATAGVELSQMIYDHSFWLGVRGAKKLANFNRLVEAKTQEDVAYNVVKIYYQAQILGQQRTVIQANLDQVDGLLRATELQFQNGFAKKLDVDQLRVNRSTLETQLRNLELQYQQTLRGLKYAMAMPLDAPIVLTDTLQNDDLPAAALQEALSPGFSNKVDLAIIDEQKELLMLQYEKTRAEYIPSARFFAGYNVQGQGNSFRELGDNKQWFDFAMMGINIKVPIFDGLRKNYRTQQDIIEVLQNEKDRAIAINGLEYQYSNALLQLESNYNSLLSQKENRRMAEEVYTVTQKRFREGLASITEVLSAETAMREVQTNYLAALLQYKWASLDLEYANGRLLQLLNK